MCLILKNWYHIKNIAKSENLLFNGNDRKWGSFFIFWYHLKKCIYSKESFSLVFADRQLQLKKMQIFKVEVTIKNWLFVDVNYAYRISLSSLSLAVIMRKSSSQVMTIQDSNIFFSIFLSFVQNYYGIKRLQIWFDKKN